MVRRQQWYNQDGATHSAIDRGRTAVARDAANGNGAAFNTERSDANATCQCTGERDCAMQ